MARIWHLGGSRWVQNTHTGCGNHLPTSIKKSTFFLKNVCLVKYVQAITVVWSENGFRKYDHMFTCIGKSPLPKWPYGMWEEITFSGYILMLLEKRYPKNQSQRWISHFSSYLVIDLFSAKQRTSEYFYYSDITNTSIISI